MTTADAIQRYLDAHAPDMAAQLAEWVAVPSIAGVPEHAPDVRRSAHWLAAALRETGFPEVEVWCEDAAPAVFARWSSAPGAPTVLVYSHHDVRAAKPEQWAETAPFEPVLREGRLYGRGASDAKGQMLTHLWSVRAHLAATGRDAPAVNLVCLVEGEEETGSSHLAELLTHHRERLSADLVVFSDTTLWHADHPAVCVSLRGMVNATLEVTAAQDDLHGGAVAGLAPNPVFELSRLLTALHDDHGRVSVPGFYDGVLDPAELGADAYRRLPFDEADWLRRTGTRVVMGEHGHPPLDRLWCRPSIEVTTIQAGDPATTSRGVIPAGATAELSIHTVPRQRHDRIAQQLRAWVAGLIRPGYDFQVEVELESAQDPYWTPAGLEAVELLSDAMAAAFGKPVGRMGNAGAGPAELLSRMIGAPVVFFGTGLPEDHWHTSDESARLDILRAGTNTLARFWAALARQGSSHAGEKGCGEAAVGIDRPSFHR